MKSTHEYLEYVNIVSQGAFDMSGFMEYMSVEDAMDIIKRAKIYHKKSKQL